jgi:hypothetical protein
MSERIEPCPFCGCGDIDFVWEADPVMQCQECGARGPEAVSPHPTGTDHRVCTYEERCSKWRSAREVALDNAEKLWNRRASSAVEHMG